ncbi:MAG: hypothetical protein FOGNACKC_00753 [Anaerolineae bacterium]|nr:hypothetical protein [Anaerolineae bacterium]
MNSGELNHKKVYEVQGRITEEGLQNSSTKLIPKYCVLIGLAGQGRTRGTVAMNMVELCTNQSIAAIFPNEKIFDCNFLYHNLDHRYDELRRLSTGSEGRGGLNLQIIKSLKINLPTLPEQRKIAECLTSLDDLIAAHGQKLDALRAHKKGLLQQLFPAEGESVPRLRFPEFRASGPWDFRELGDFITERNESPQEKIPLFSLTIENGVTEKTERYERSFLVKNEEDAYKLVLPDDFAYNPMNLRFGAIARHSGAEKVALSKYYNIFYCDQSVDSRFCEHYFKSDKMIKFYDNMATGSLIEKRRVHFSDFLKFNIRFPILAEQRKIAECLSALDEQIAAQGQKIAALNAHKKGLLQQLFPIQED